MTFKLKSGNSPKFKMVGSSPAKATDSGLNTPEADAILRRNQQYLDLKAERAAEAQRQQDMIDYALGTYKNRVKLIVV